MKRFIALLLLALVFSGALFSCSKKGPSSDDSSFAGDFRKADYQGETFTFLTVKHTDTISDHYGGGFIDAETYTGNVISDKVYERNLAVEEFYNVKIEEIVRISSDPGDVINSYRLAGDVCFDAVYGWGYKLFACVPSGSFLDITALPDVDTKKSYWAPSALEDLKVNDGLYAVTCDISMNRLKWADVIFVNNSVLKETSLSFSPANLVTDGSWTYDKYLQLITEAGGNDIYGLISYSSYGSEILKGCDVYLADANGPAKVTDDFSKKLYSIVNSAYLVYNDTSLVLTREKANENRAMAESIKDDPWEYALDSFSGNKALFCSCRANYASVFKRAGTDYSILPIPKYNEAQDHYNATVSPLASMIAIPVEVRSDIETGSYERTGTVLEYLAYKSEEILYPQYTRELLFEDGDKNLRKTDLQLIDIIYNSTRYDLCDLSSVQEATQLTDDMLSDPQNALSAYNDTKPEIDKKLQEIYDSLP